MKNHRVLFATLAFSWACGGAPAPYTAQMADQPVSTSAMAVSTPIQRPLYLVVTEGKVASVLGIQGTPHTIAGFDAFVGKSLAQALGPHFASVKVVSSPAEVPSEPHFVAEFAVPSVKGKPVKIEGETATALLMQWSLSLRDSESQTALFTASGEGVGEAQHQPLDDTIKQMMTSTLSMLRQVWVEKDVDHRLRSVAAGPDPHDR